MTYRDETETLRAQVSKLEGELAAANAQVARLRGDVPATPAEVPAPDRLVGEPLLFDEEHTLPYRVSEAGYEAIAAALKERLGIAVAQVGRSLEGPGFTLRCEGETTRVKLRTDLRLLRASVVSGAGLMALLGALPTVGVMMDLAQHGVGSPLHALWAVPALLVGAGYATRRLARRRAREGGAKHSGTLAAVLDIAQQHRLASEGGESTARVRVELASERTVETPASAAPQELAAQHRAVTPLERER